MPPVVDRSGTFPEFRQMGGFGAVDPVSKQLFSRLGVWQVHKEQEVVFEEVIGWVNKIKKYQKKSDCVEKNGKAHQRHRRQKSSIFKLSS